MRIVAPAVVGALVLALIAACGDDKAGIGDACAKAQDCESGTCTGEGYCSQTDCEESGKSCPSGWSCVTSKDVLTLGLTTSSICIPSCASCPAGTSCSNGVQTCSRPIPAADAAVAACKAHEGESCTFGTSGVCCDGECGLSRYDPATSNTTSSCVLRCPTACAKPGWSCHDFSATAGYDHPTTGEFCFPSPPVVTVAQSPNPGKKNSEDVTLTASATSPAGLAIIDYTWEKNGLFGGRGAVIHPFVSETGDAFNHFKVSARDETNQISTATIDVVAE